VVLPVDLLKDHEMVDHEELPRQEVRNPNLEGCGQILGDSPSCSSSFPMRARMAKQEPKAVCSKPQLGRQEYGRRLSVFRLFGVDHSVSPRAEHALAAAACV